MELGQVRDVLRGRQAVVLESKKIRAAVAMVLFEADAGLQVLFIERAKRAGDPWSGHLAFPGGRVDAGDVTVRHTAERETLEEVGLDLGQTEFLGRLDDVKGSMTPVVVSGFVYHIAQKESFTLDAEVQDAFWVSMDDLLDPKRHMDYPFHFQNQDQVLPGVDLLGPGRPVLWGLTYRFVVHFLELMGHAIPSMPPFKTSG